MTTEIKLTDTQRQVLEHAASQPDGRITWFPDHVKGGARQKVIAELFKKGLITSNGGQDWFVTAEGYDAMGMERPNIDAMHTSKFEAKLDEIIANAEAAQAEQGKQAYAKRLIEIGLEGKPKTRENSKQAEVIRMLQRPEGATIHQICEVTGWKAHTVRGTFAGVFKKKLGLTITSDKPEGGERVYRLA